MPYDNLKEKFNDVKRQHNIMALVGNGFDIQALSDLGAPSDTRYESFFHYLKYRRFSPDNHIFQEMEFLLSEGKTNWCDVEFAIESLLTRREISPEKLSEDLGKIQREFANFLNQVVTPDILTNLGESSMKNEWAIASLMEFLGDIRNATDFGRIRFPRRLDHCHAINFQFINFNFTTLLDDFIYLDQKQFDPHPYEHSDRNATFYANPRKHETYSYRPKGHRENTHDAWFRIYLACNIVHPHGILYTPRSLLFGIDETTGPAERFSKPYWSQNELRYKDLFPETDLFIIFGCSLGHTDRWWWRSIADALLKETEDQEKPELLLYWRKGSKEAQLTADDLRWRFAKAAGLAFDQKVQKMLASQIHVVLYDDSTMDRVWLNTRAFEFNQTAHFYVTAKPDDAMQKAGAVPSPRVLPPPPFWPPKAS